MHTCRLELYSLSVTDYCYFRPNPGNHNVELQDDCDDQVELGFGMHT